MNSVARRVGGKVLQCAQLALLCGGVLVGDNANAAVSVKVTVDVVQGFVCELTSTIPTLTINMQEDEIGPGKLIKPVQYDVNCNNRSGYSLTLEGEPLAGGTGQLKSTMAGLGFQFFANDQLWAVGDSVGTNDPKVPIAIKLQPVKVQPLIADKYEATAILRITPN